MNVPPSASVLAQFGFPASHLAAPTLQFSELDYQQFQDAPAVFAEFSDEPWAMLLDSAQAQHPNSRYDILVRKPHATIRVEHSHSYIEFHHTNDGATNHTLEIATTALNPLQLLNLWMPTLTPTKIPAQFSDLPFIGGFVGLFGYDLGRTLEQLPSSALADIHIADLAVGLYFHALIIDHQEQRAVAIHPAGEPPAFAKAAAQAPKVTNFQLTSPWQSNLSAEQYQQGIAKVHEYLRAGDCYQINLAQRFSATYTGSPWHAYQALRRANQAPFSAFLQIPNGSILSVSPERFLQTTSTGQVSTRPIKGTRPRRQNAAEDQVQIEQLQNSAKDQAENLMIVDLLRNDISRVCAAGSVSVPELFKIESFNAVHHLVSTVTGQLAPNETPFSLLAAAFPGGSITGAPKIRAMEIIEELEPHRRSAYCGAIGYFSCHGRSDTSITIRTLVCSEQRIHCWAGGGIVIDSEAAAEYQETFDKVARILPVLTALNMPSEQPASDSIQQRV